MAQSWSESDNALWRQLGYDYQVAKFTARTHVIVAPYVNGLYHEVVDGCSSSSSAGCSDSSLHAAANVLDPDPARVVFKTLPSSWAPEIGLRYDRAYWVSGMRVRTVTSSSSFGRVDATSLALAQKLRAPIEQLDDPELRTFGPTGDNYLFQAIRWGSQPGRAEQRLVATLQNLSAATFDLPRMRLRRDGPVRMTLSGDGTTVLTLLGTWPDRTALRVVVDGVVHQTVRAQGGRVTLRLDLRGTHDYRVARSG